MYTIGGTGAAHGTVVLSGSTFIYTPSPNFHGSDSFTYFVEDPFVVSNTSTVDITITPVNDAPIALNDVEVTNEDTPIQINPLTNDSDIDGDVLSITGTLVAQNGTAVLSGSTVTYSPNPNFV